jgi:pilin isopeptide linkage protein
MAGKKTGKRLLTWVLVLVMALSLLPLNALAAGGSETDSGSGMIFTKKLVSDVPDKDGNYTIQMTAQATGKEVETTKPVPMDIVLVLDQSGSMADDFNGNSTNNNEARRQYAMKAAVNSFIGEVADKYSTDADHHMAIVIFSDDAETLVGWTAVDKDGGASELTDKISALSNTPSGATNVEAGMTKTQSLMSNAPTGQSRQKTVIVFTDGVPTTGTRFNVDVANKALEIAQNMKNDGVSIYTIGVFSGADIKQLYGKGCNGNVGDKWGEVGFLWFGDVADVDRPAGNRFLNYLSSNFKNANKIGLRDASWDIGLVHYDGWKITQNFTRTSSDYYKTAVDASDLNGIFKTISSMVPAPGNPALDEKTVITDTLSDYFTFALTEDGKVDVKVYAEKGNEKTDITDKVTVNPNSQTKTVTVTDYDFSKHHTESDDPEELVIEIKVKPSGDGCTSKEIPTNDDTAEPHAARVEVEVKSEDGTGTETKIVTSHETAKVTGHQVIYELAGGKGDITGNGLYYPQDAAVPVTNSVPTLEGHEFTGWKSNIEGDNKVYTSDGTNSSITMPAANVILTAQWTVNTDTKYTVNHYQQNLDDNDYKLFETESDKTGTTGEQTTATAKNYEGFTAKPVEQKTIAADGSTVVDIYYDRNTYSVTYTDGVNNETIFEDEVHQSVKYGASVPAYNNGTDPSRENYTFAGWEPSVPATMPANNLMFAAKWEKNPVGDGTFDFNDVISGDGKNTPAITKTVKGNVGRNFKETFKVTVEPKSDNAKNTMTPDYYTGKAEVIASKSLKDVPFLFKPEVMANAVVPYGKLRFTEAGTYTYTVQEIPGETSRMSYDTTEYTLTIMVALDEDSNTYQVKSWQFTPGNREYPDALNIVNTYRTYHPSTPSKPTLNTGDHYAYVMGYPDGTVRPNGSITRAEVSAILFRLLSDKTRDEYFTTESSFTDVKAGAWYNNSIATLEKAGVIVDTAKGGAFRPNEAITRAELAAMLAQFSDAKPVKGVKFSDVSAGHWAYEAIAIAAKMGWIEGYPDGTFRPDATITRAEMMTLVNRALERVPSDEDHLLSKRVMLTFPDCKSGDWFYIAVQEATNSHTYERAATEKNGDEQWTALRANRDWTLLEK